MVSAEERYRSLVDAIRDYAIFLLDPTGHVASWNAGVINSLQRLGVADAQVHGALQRLGEQAAQAGRVVQRIRQFLTKREPRWQHRR